MGFNAETFLKIGKELGVPAAAMAALLLILHFGMIVPMNAREDRHVNALEALAKSETTQTEILRGMAYDTKFGTWRVAPPPSPESVPDVAPPPPPKAGP